MTAGEMGVAVADPPLISVGLPVYNGAKYLDDTISSILAQDVPYLELIISDNGSTDATRSIIHQRCARDERIRAVFRDDNRGAAWNFNYVLGLAQGEYFHWSGHDDLMDPSMLRECISALRETKGAVLAYPRTKIINEHGILVEEYDNGMHLTQQDAVLRLKQYLWNVGLANPILGVFPTKEIRAVGGLGAYPSADLVTLARLGLRGQIIEVPEPLFSRRIHEKQSWRDVGFYEGLAHWLDPERRAKIVFTDWRVFGELLLACFKEDLPVAQRMRCIAVVLYGWPRRRWRRLIKEILRIGKPHGIVN